jgi:hypothetical protein
MAATMEKFEAAVRAFCTPGWRDDVTALNQSLKRPTSGTAGFVDQPPSLLTGDPFRVRRGEGLLVLGLNPKWQGDDARFRHNDADPARATFEQCFQSYRTERAKYFTEDGAAYYGKYFTRLANALALAFFDVPVPTRHKAIVAKRFCRKYVAKFDLLPWWSSVTAKIDNGKVRTDVSPIGRWASVIRLATEALEPRAIVVNGSSWLRLVEDIFSIELNLFTYDDPGRPRSHAYAGAFDGVPVIVHGQLNAQGGASHAGYANLVARARELAAD